MNFQETTRRAAKQFVQDERNDGSKFVKLVDDSWVDSMEFHKAVDDRLPCDWIYGRAREFVEILSGYKCETADDAREYITEVADGMVEIYSSELAKWYANGNNRGLVEEAKEEGLFQDGAEIDAMISAGQFIAIDRLAHDLINQIEQRQEEYV
jgi:hypothetical protein